MEEMRVYTAGNAATDSMEVEEEPLDPGTALAEWRNVMQQDILDFKENLKQQYEAHLRSLSAGASTTDTDKSFEIPAEPKESERTTKAKAKYERAQQEHAANNKVTNKFGKTSKSASVKDSKDLQTQQAQQELQEARAEAELLSRAVP